MEAQLSMSVGKRFLKDLSHQLELFEYTVGFSFIESLVLLKILLLEVGKKWLRLYTRLIKVHFFQ